MKLDKRSGIYLAAAMLLPHTRREDDPDKWCLDTALRYADALWNRTGCDQPPRETGQRKTEDHYGRLDPRLRALFDRLWTAYAHKHGKQRAAARFAEINPTDAQAQAMIQAAAADAQAPRQPGQVRKYLEGWLSERRWEDHVPAAGAKQADHAARQIREITGALAQAKDMAAKGVQAEYWQGEIERLTEQLRELRSPAP